MKNSYLATEKEFNAAMRTIHTDEIISNIREMCIEANLTLSPDMQQVIKQAQEREDSPLGKQILGQFVRIWRLRRKTASRSVRIREWQSYL